MDCSRTTRSIAAAALLGGALLLVSGSSLAHNQQIEIGGKLVKLDTRKAPAAHTFIFKATAQAQIAPQHDPAVVGAAVLVRWIAAGGDGRTALVQLDASKWKGLGKPPGSKGYKYSDRDGTQGGIKLLLYQPEMIKIVAKGANWPWELTGPNDELWVHFRVEDEWYCAQLGTTGTIVHNEPGRFQAKEAAQPGACPAQVCGNGVQELGEDCDDGNLEDLDGCTNSCTAEACSSAEYDSTWEAIQDVVFTGYGCTSLICHGAPPGQGNLNLSPASAHANLVNVVSSVSPLTDRVEPGDEALSVLYDKLQAGTQSTLPVYGGGPMPSGGTPLTADHLEALRRWIRAGAPESGIVAGTADLLGTCLPPPTPNKIPPLDPPALGQGFQIYAPPWPLPGQSEREVCYAVYYDLGQIPGAVQPGSEGPCPTAFGGASQTCIFWNKTVLAQDPQSHHSLLKAYIGAYPVTDPSWGPWTCKGGSMAGTACNPTGIGIPAPAGADCGLRAGCTGAITTSLACIGYGPPDFGFDVNGSGTANAPNVGGSQVPLHTNQLYTNVYGPLRKKGVFVINSHAFNLTDIDSTMEQYFNVHFAPSGQQQYLAQAIFNSSQIFVMNVPPFESREYCWTHTVPNKAQVFELSSHRHKRGTLFRIWAPPHTPCSSVATCTVPAGAPLYASTDYTDPLVMRFDPPTNFSGQTTSNRTYKWCSKYDNGETDPSAVKRQSTSPPGLVGGPCADSATECIGGANHGQLCFGSDANCPGGECDACPVTGGVTTEDEMNILLGEYYVLP